MSLNDRHRPAPLWLRALFALPVIGWIAHDLLHGSSDTIYYLLVALATLWILAVMTWGLPALTLPALVSVPVVLLVLVLLTIGK